MDERCLLTTHTIKCELEFLAGMVGASTTLIEGYDAERDEYRFRWNVSAGHIVALANMPAEDLRLSLEAFSARYCAPAVKAMREGMNV